MLTNCFAACAHLTITVPEIQRDIGRKSSIFSYPPLHSTPQLGGSRRNSATPFGMEKLEWFGYPMLKKFRRYVYSFWRDPRTWRTHRRTSGWRHIPRLCIGSRGKNCAVGMLKLTTGKHEASRGLSATAELLVSFCLLPVFVYAIVRTELVHLVSNILHVYAFQICFIQD